MATVAGLAAPFALPVLGVILLSIGAGMAWTPLGFIVPGALLLADHVATVRAGRP